MSIRLNQEIHRMLMGYGTPEKLIVVDHRGLVATSGRAYQSHTVHCAVEFLELDPSINQQATRAYPEPFVILGPLGVAAYRATWMEELDATGRRVLRQPNEHGASLPTNTTTVVGP